MWKYLNSFHKLFFIFWFIQGCVTPQKKESDNLMPEFYRDDIKKTLDVDTLVTEIKASKNINLLQSEPEKYSGGYFFRYLSPGKNSRLLSEYKTKNIWEVKWRAELDPTLFPWFLLFGDDRIIVQNESGWQMFDTSGKFIMSSSKSDGNLSIDIKNKLFYQNDFTGFLAANNLVTGENEFFIYPYFGQGYDRNLIWYNEHKFLCIGYEIPVMTHKSTPKEPDITLFEILDVRDKSMIDSDKILNSAQQVQKLILKATNVKTAFAGDNIIAVSDDFISVIDINLNIKKLFHGKFVPVELSIDEQLNISLIVRIDNEDGTFKFFLWLINKNGELINDTELPVENKNQEFCPPVPDFNLNTFIITGNRLFFIDSKGEIKWERFLADISPGASVSTNGYLLTSEGNYLNAFDINGERNFIFNFESEKLYSPPLLTPQNEIYVATKNSLYCLKIKEY